MRIDFTGRQMEVSPDLRLYTEERLRKLTRLLHDHFDIHVILTAEKHRRIAEITLKFRDHVLVGIEETGDARSSINGALGKLERQAVRFLARRWATMSCTGSDSNSTAITVSGWSGAFSGKAYRRRRSEFWSNRISLPVARKRAETALLTRAPILISEPGQACT